jgi:NAD(P)-dependent dehydrogenase (short-subunit alcohol dehydrogenase family)
MNWAIVTGGADGIGLAIVKELVRLEYQVVLLDKKELKEKIKNINYFNVDINDLDLIDKILSQYESFDLLVNNAAIQNVKKFMDYSDREIDEVINTNLLSLMKLSRRVVERMNAGGQVINLGSVHSVLPRKHKLTYDVSKAGLDMFTKGLALELAPRIRVNSVNIGATISPMNSVFEDELVMEEAKKKVPMNHIFKAEEIARVVVSLLSDDFKYMTGSIVVYDGGRSLN